MKHKPGLGNFILPILEAQAANWRRPLTIIETGTMYYTKLEPGEADLSARSTYAIAQFIEKSGMPHKFFSIDIEGGHIDNCKDGLGELARHVNFIRAAGEEGLYSLIHEDHEGPDFVLLDADSDGDVIAAEFDTVAPEMTHGIIVIDDVFKPHKVNKGRVVLPALDRVGKRWYNIGGIAAGIPIDSASEAILQGLAIR